MELTRPAFSLTSGDEEKTICLCSNGRHSTGPTSCESLLSNLVAPYSQVRGGHPQLHERNLLSENFLVMNELFGEVVILRNS